MKHMHLTGFDFIKEHLRGRRILDVGNIGKGGSQYKKIIESFPDCEIIGLDNNIKRARELKLPNQVIGDAHKMPFSDNYFDGVIMAEILEHTFEPQKMIQEARRVLKIGGMLIVTTPNPYALARILRFFFKGMDVIGEPSHKIFYTPAIFKNIFGKNGFKIEIISTTAIRIKFKNINLLRFKTSKMLGGNICVKAIKK